MSDCGEFLGQSVPFTINGKEYLFSKITLGIMADFEAAMNMRKYQRALALLGPDATSDERIAIADKLAKDAVRSADLSQLESVEGVRTMLYLCLKPNHPDITEEQVGQMVGLQEVSALQNFLDLLLDAPAMNSIDEGNAPRATDT